MRTVLLLRRTLDGAGGAERVFKKYLRALEGQDCQVIPVSEAKGSKGPSWWRAITYTWMADKQLRQYPGALSISLERGPESMIYRAGDGVHRHWRKLLGGVSFNPLHVVAPILEAKSLRAAEVVIANSKMVAGELHKYYPWIGNKVRVVYNGFDPKRFGVVSPETKAELRKKLELPEGPLFLFVGSGWKRKGLRQALSIVNACQKIKPTLVVLGKGKANQLTGEPAIYRGVVDNTAEYYQACDAFVLPTLYDPFSNVVLEALACGLPVVTTATNGASEVVKAGITGYIMPHPDKNHKEAASWLENNLDINPEMISETVGTWTLDHEIAAIKKIFGEISSSNFKGIVIEESLKNSGILEKLNIISTKVEPVTDADGTPWVKQWTMHTVEVPAAQVAMLVEELRRQLVEQVEYEGKCYKDKWYADWKSSTKHYIIFPRRVFCIDRRKPAEYEEARKYGLSLGIPAAQLDFSSEVIVP